MWRRRRQRRTQREPRTGPSTYEFDEVGVRARTGDVVREIRWDELTRVAIRTTDEGPYRDDLFWLLGDDEGVRVVVPSEDAPDGFIKRLQQLPGFDNGALLDASTCTTDEVFLCWPPPPAEL